MIKIGILIKEFDKLEYWELEIINQIINNPYLRLELLVKDGRNQNFNNYRNSFLSRLIFKIQKIIERKFFFPTKKHPNHNNILSYLNKTETLTVNPIRKRYVDFFNDTDSNRIKEKKLDILLRHGFGIIKGEVLNSTKFGIWSFHHGDNSINRGGPAGFWEIVLNEDYVGVTLQKLTDELDGGEVIDKAFFNRHWSYIKTRDLIYQSSISLLFKNLKFLNYKRFKTKKSEIYYNRLYRSPNLYYTFFYIFKFYKNLLERILKKILSKIFGVKFNSWTLFIGKGNFLNSTLFRLKPVKVPRNEFWADPFLYEYDKENFIFFENYCYKSKKGKISCGKIKNGNLHEVKDVLDLDYHLSYPFIFEEDNVIYMIPETHQNKRLEIFKCINFPDKWELYSTAFEGELIVDTTYFRDKENNKWLFLNKSKNLDIPFENELYIYKIDDLMLNKIVPHDLNPVLIDSRVARNAGPIFKHDNFYYRPSQANVENIYGRYLNINKIVELSLSSYKEEKILVVKPNFHKNLNAIHHMHQYKNQFVFDSAFKFKVI